MATSALQLNPSHDTRTPPARLRSALPSLAWAGLVAGVSLVTYAYARAAVIFHTQTHYHLFWLGIFVFTIPACLRLLSAGAGRLERLSLLIAVGMFDFLPKFLRDPQYPLYHDEVGHWRQAEAVYSSGSLFRPNPVVPIIQYFPGLHAATAALRDLSGLTTFQIGTALILALHAMALVGVFVAAEQLTRDARIAAVAAFLYSLNASFMYFDSQYSYESLAIVFFIWVVALTVRMQRAEDPLSTQVRCGLLALVLTAACLITHHLTSYMLVLALLFLAAVTAARAWQGRERRSTAALTGALALIVTAMALVWLLCMASRVIGYLEPSLHNGLAQMMRLLAQEDHSRTLFRQSPVPGYERAAAFLSPVITAAGAALGLWVVRRERPSAPAMRALVVFGLLYFPSVPLMLTQGGSEGARRTWAFTYLGLAILIAPGLVWLLRRSDEWPRWPRRLLPAGLAMLCVTVLVGNVTVPMNDAYRFPGAFTYGSDTRSISPELQQTARWLQRTYGPGQGVVADRYTALGLDLFGSAWTMPDGTGFPRWQMFLSTTPASPQLLRSLQYMGYRFLVVDKRMVHQLPLLGFYVTVSEPEAGQRTAPPPPGVITKYDREPWVTKVYESAHYEVFRFNDDAIPGPRLTARELMQLGSAARLPRVPSVAATSIKEDRP